MSVAFTILQALGVIALAALVSIGPIYWLAGVYERRRPPVIPRARREYLEQDRWLS